MYTIVRSSHPATAVEHSLACNFFSRAEQNLVVAGANVLRVYRLVPDLDKEQTQEEEGRLKLECLASWQLFGWVQVL